MDKIETPVIFWKPEKILDIKNFLRSKPRPDRVKIQLGFHRLEKLVQDSNISPDGLFESEGFKYAGLCIPIERLKLMGGLENFTQFKPCYGRPNVAFWFPMPSGYLAQESKGKTYPKAIRLLFIDECQRLVRESLEDKPRADEAGFGTY